MTHIPAISRLFKACCPSAISGLVIAVVVDAVNGMRGRWLRSHIGEERLKRIAPSLTNRDASASVVGVSRIVRIETAFPQAEPRMIFGGVFFGSRLAVFNRRIGPSGQKSLPMDFSIQTAATSAPAVGQVVAAHDNGLSAVASASPRQVGIAVRVTNDSGRFNSHKTAESLIGKVSAFHRLVMAQTVDSVHAAACARYLGRGTALSLFIIALFALPVAAQEPTPAFPNHTAQKVADVASYGTLGAELGLQIYDAFKAPDGGHQIAKAMFGLSAAWAGAGILKTVTHRARPCAPFCGHDDPYASFPSQHAWLACQALYGEHKDWKAWLAIATSVLRPLADKHHPTDVLAGCGFGWATTKVFP